jgi:hypothetical protein
MSNCVLMYKPLFYRNLLHGPHQDEGNRWSQAR